MRSLSLAILIVLTLTGCSSASIKPLAAQNPEDAAKFIIYRPNNYAAMLNDMIVAIDGNEIAILKNEQFLTAMVSAGKHTISVRGTAGLTSELTVNPGPAETLYFEAAGSANNAINFIPGTVLLKPNFYIEQAASFDEDGFVAVPVTYN